MNQRNNRNHRKQNKEKIIMIASSAFVMMALTMTGIYMKDKQVESKDEEYSIDFTALGEESEEEEQEQYVMREEITPPPMQEVDSGQVTIPGLTDQSIQQEIGTRVIDEILTQLDVANQTTEEQEEPLLEEEEDVVSELPEIEDEADEIVSQSIEVSKSLSFAPAEGLLMPVEGMILMEYSMDATIYHATLDQYKYNPAVVITTPEGSSVQTCADGKIIEISKNEEIGNYVRMDLGDGYVATYGQLSDIRANVGDYVDVGVAFAKVAQPTKYYSVEGSNLYFQVTCNGVAANPEVMFQ